MDLRFSWRIWVTSSLGILVAPLGWNLLDLSVDSSVKQIEDIEQFYRKYGDWAIVIARQIPACGSQPSSAGASAVSMGRFMIDGLSALVTVNLYLGLGYYFADDAARIRQNTESFIEYAGYISGIVMLLIVVRFAYRRWKG